MQEDNYIIEILVGGKSLTLTKEPEKPFTGILEKAEVKDIAAVPPHEVYIDGQKVTEYAIWLISREIFFMDAVKPGQWVSFRWTFDSGATYFDYGVRIVEQTQYVKWGRPKKQ